MELGVLYRGEMGEANNI